MTTTSIVLVEDDAKFREAFTGAITDAQDMQLLGAAANCAQGVSLLQSSKPDVLLVDLDLPDQPGVQLIRFAAKHLPNCEVMVITVFGDERHVIESIEAGATGYLLKDASPTEYLEQIRLLRAGGSPISPVIARQLLTRFHGAATPAVMDETDHARLSERESTVLNMISKGYTSAEIARLISVSPHTVLTYVKRIYNKLQVSSKAEALHEARVRGLVQD